MRHKATELGLALIAKCLQGLGFDEEHARSTVCPLRTLHDLRTKLKGHAVGNEKANFRAAALAKYGSFRRHFEELCCECDVAMQHIIEPLSQE